MPDDAKEPFDVIVLGGGITGLVATWKMAEAGKRVALIDKAAELGGVIRTFRHEDWLLDIGPNSIGFAENDDIHEMITQLQISNDLVLRPVRESDRYIWRRGQLRRVPVSPLQLFKKNALSRRMITRAAFQMWRPHPMPSSDISVGAYFSTTVGRKVVHNVLAPAIAGIYAADPFRLSMQSVMPSLYEASRGTTSLGGALRKMKREKSKAQKASGRRVMGSFLGGMETLSRALAGCAANAGAHVVTGVHVTEIRQRPDQIWELKTSDGLARHATKVICTLPASQTAELLQDVAPETAEALTGVKYARMIIAHVGVKESDVGVSCPGFGFLSVRDAGVRALGMIWSDRMFPNRAPSGHRLFTVFLGGEIDPAACSLSDSDILEVIQNDMRLVMKWMGSSLEMHKITRLPAAIPIMEVGHSERIRKAQSHLPQGLLISGNYVAGVSVPSCMRAGALLAQELSPPEQQQ